MLSTLKEEFKFFNTLSDDDLLNFLNFCENRQVAAGEILRQEGDTCNYSVFILSGLVGLFSPLTWGSCFFHSKIIIPAM